MCPVLINNESGNAEDVDPKLAQELLASGSHGIPLNDAQGNPVIADSLEAARKLVAEGHSQPTAENLSDLLKAGKYNTPIEKAKTFAEGLGEGATFGLSTALEKGLTGATDEDIQGRREYNSGYHTAGNIAGLVGSTIYGGEGKMLAEAGEGAAKLLGLGEASTLGARAASGATRLGVENALMTAGDETSKYIAGDPDNASETAISNIGLSALLGAGFGGALGSAGYLWDKGPGAKITEMLSEIKNDASGNAVHPVLKKTLSVLGGVAEKDIDAYAANREAINSVPEFREVYDHALSHVEDVLNQHAEKKISLEGAQAEFKDLQRSIRDDLRQKGYEASLADKFAKQALKTAQTDTAMKIQQGALDSAKGIAEAVEGLRAKAIEGSQAAKDLLINSGEEVNLSPMFKRIDELQADLEAKASPEAKAMSERLENYRKSVIDQYGETAPAHGAKSIIQGLDDLSKYDFNAATFDKGMSPLYKQIRYSLDDTLKEAIPEYRKAMAPVADDFRLLRQLDRYGTEEDATRALKSIKNVDRYKNEMPILRQLEEKTGTNLLESVEKYANPETRASLMKNLPEFAEAEKAAEALRTIKDPSTVRMAEDSLKDAPEFRKLTEAQQAFEDAVRKREGIKGLSPANLEGKLTAAMRGKINPGEVVGSLPEMGGQNLSDILSNMRTAEAFKKGAQSGSRNVNLFGGLLGGVAGAVTGHLMPAIGVGAGIGAYMDKYGPQVVKSILDQYLDRIGPQAAKALGDASPSALRVALAKALDYTGDLSSAGFKAAVNTVTAAMRGEETANKAAKAVFTQTKMPDVAPKPKDIEKLKEKVTEYTVTPDKMLKVADGVGHYMPDHATAMSTVTGRAVSYLNSIRPNQDKANPLDPTPVVSKSEEAAYERQLTIAQSPLTVLEHIKEGTLIPEDIKTLYTIYPKLYNGMVQKLTNELVTHLADGGSIPYKTKLSLALFTAKPLDSTMQPQAIQTAQSAFIVPENPPQMGGGGRGKKGSPKALAKMGDRLQTGAQRAESAKFQA